MAGARKVVTVVFADVAGFTALGEALDPEAVRRVIERYFGEARSVLEQHGGKVEKFIGDAVMAVFGIPRLHDDDALRAVRAATELQGRLAASRQRGRRQAQARASRGNRGSRSHAHQIRARVDGPALGIGRVRSRVERMRLVNAISRFVETMARR